MPFPDATQINALTQVGFFGAVVIFVWLLYRGVVIFRREKADADVVSAERLAEMKADRDEWKNIARSAVAKVGPLTTALEKSIAKLDAVTTVEREIVEGQGSIVDALDALRRRLDALDMPAGRDKAS